MSHVETIKRPGGRDEDWKKKVSKVLRECGVIGKAFTGTVELSLCDGGVAGATRKDTIR